jgi:hypothetical protein
VLPRVTREPQQGFVSGEFDGVHLSIQSAYCRAYLDFCQRCTSGSMTQRGITGIASCFRPVEDVLVGRTCTSEDYIYELLSALIENSKG